MELHNSIVCIMQLIWSKSKSSINFLYYIHNYLYTVTTQVRLYCYDHLLTSFRWLPHTCINGSLPHRCTKPLFVLALLKMSLIWMSLLLIVILWNTFAYTICDSNIIAASSESTKETTCGDSQATMLDPTAIPIQGKHQWGQTAVTIVNFMWKWPDSFVPIFSRHLLCSTILLLLYDPDKTRYPISSWCWG